MRRSWNRVVLALLTVAVVLQSYLRKATGP